jgi:activator of HSP90 ATPase
MPRTRTITQKFVVAAPPAEVYDALVSPRKLAAVTGSPATGSRRVGGRFTVWDGYITGVHRELVASKRIADDWRTTEWPEGAADSRVTLTFKKVARGTEVRMVHSNVPAEQAARYRQGWIDYYWTPLKLYFLK